METLRKIAEKITQRKPVIVPEPERETRRQYIERLFDTSLKNIVVVGERDFGQQEENKS